MRKIAIILATLAMIIGGCSSSTEMTATDVQQMSGTQKGAFFVCQQQKFVDDKGKAAWDSYIVKQDSPVGLEENLIEMGYSCTEEEANEVLPGAFS